MGARNKWRGVSCELGTGILGYTKCAQLDDQLRNFQILKDFLLWSVGRSVNQADRQTDRTLTTFAHHINTENTVTTERQSMPYKWQLHQNGRQKKHFINYITNNFGLIFALLHSASQYFHNTLFRYEHTLKMNMTSFRGIKINNNHFHTQATPVLPFRQPYCNYAVMTSTSKYFQYYRVCSSPNQYDKP